jgi:hypothetical protein
MPIITIKQCDECLKNGIDTYIKETDQYVICTKCSKIYCDNHNGNYTMHVFECARCSYCDDTEYNIDDYTMDCYKCNKMFCAYHSSACFECINELIDDNKRLNYLLGVEKSCLKYLPIEVSKNIFTYEKII